MANLIPIVELGVAEAYAILTQRLGEDPRDLPPLEAIENEDWGRDLLLSRFLEHPAEALAAAGVRLDEGPRGGLQSSYKPEAPAKDQDRVK